MMNGAGIALTLAFSHPTGEGEVVPALGRLTFCVNRQLESRWRSTAHRVALNSAHFDQRRKGEVIAASGATAVMSTRPIGGNGQRDLSDRGLYGRGRT